ncbi:MAG: glutamyl-tRNA reductase [Frankiales bacterium]|nr:glutamyl-tRNA reductase [Frankiales bacterium]
MSVLVVGLSHRSAPVSLLEKLTVAPEQVADVLADLLAGDHVSEAIVLSTCNRVEVYAEVSKFHGGVADVSAVLEKRSGVSLDAVPDQLYVHYEDRAVQHLFEVAAGLDSMVIGEAQILGQLRHALRIAQDESAVGRTLNELGQQALRVGKRVHAETGIDRAGASLVSVGVQTATAAVGDPAGLHAVVVGAGSMSGLAAATLQRLGVRRLDVVNRTQENADRLALSYGGTGFALPELPGRVAQADLVVSCTGSVGTVISAETLEGRQGRPIALLDLALPRDIDPGVRAVAGVTLIDLEILGAQLEAERGPEDVEAARLIVTDEVGGFLAWQRATRVAPTVVALRSKADELVAAELARLDTRLPGLDAKSRTEVAQAVRRVVEKLLHTPTVRVKQLAETPGGHAYADALGELFGLDPAAIDSVSRAAVELTPIEGEQIDGGAL